MSFSDEPLVGKFVWFDLITDDAETDRRFYGGLFGWTFETTEGPRGHEYLLIRSAEAYVGGIVTRADAPDGIEFSRWLPYGSVANIDASVDRAGSLGGEPAAVTVRKWDRFLFHPRQRNLEKRVPC